MFWIGLIVGVVLTVAIAAAYIMWCFWVCKIDRDEYCDYVEVMSDAIRNRESTLQVYHDGELLNEVTFKEK